MKELELAGNFEAAAELRQQLRDIKRAERKKLVALQNASANEQEEERKNRIAQAEKRRGDIARIKGRVALERQAAKQQAEAKRKERENMLAACETDEERAALLAKWEAERLAEEAEAERLRLLALEQRYNLLIFKHAITSFFSL